MNIDEMQAGRELDVKIAELIGWTKGHDAETIESDDAPGDPDYFEPFVAYDVFLESPEGEREYLHDALDLSAPRIEWTYDRRILPRYSADENDAGLVLDYLATQGYMITVYSGPYRDEGIKARCCILRPRDIDRVDAVADTRPLAICEAALMAVERWG